MDAPLLFALAGRKCRGPSGECTDRGRNCSRNNDPFAKQLRHARYAEALSFCKKNACAPHERDNHSEVDLRQTYETDAAAFATGMILMAQIMADAGR